MGNEKDTLDIKQIVKKLKYAREQKGYTLEDVYKATKISIMNLEAIENGKFDLLPHPVYTRAFIKAYAQFVEIDPTDILKAYDEYLKESKKQTPPKVKKKQVDQKNKITIFSVSIVVLIILFATIIYFFTQKKQNEIQKIQNKNETRVEVTKNNTMISEGHVSKNKNNTDASMAKNATNNNDMEKLELKPENNSTEHNNTNKSMGNEISNKSNENNTINNSGGKDKAELDGKQQASELTNREKTNYLKIKANDDCWIGAKIDGITEKELILRKDHSVTFEYKDYIEIKFGNLGGVELYNNGERLDIKGKPGEVKVIKIPLNE